MRRTAEHASPQVEPDPRAIAPKPLPATVAFPPTRVGPEHADPTTPEVRRTATAPSWPEPIAPGAPVWPSHLPSEVDISDERWPSLLAPAAARPELVAERAERERERQRRLLAEQRGETWSA